MENPPSLKSPELQAAIDKYSPFLAEARKRLISTFCVFAATTFVGFIFYENIIRFLLTILSLKGVNIVFTSPFQFINLAISCGIASGLIVSFPLFVIQILFFLKPALRETEYRMVIHLLPYSLILFVLGLTFGFFVMKWQIEIFLDKSLTLGIGNILDISRLLTTVLITSVLMGIAFEFPIILFLLLRLKILYHQQLTKIRLWVYLIPLLFVIILPLDSILTDIFLTLPLILLFELTLLFHRLKKN